MYVFLDTNNQISKNMYIQEVRDKKQSEWKNERDGPTAIHPKVAKQQWSGYREPVRQTYVNTIALYPSDEKFPTPIFRILHCWNSLDTNTSNSL